MSDTQVRGPDIGLISLTSLGEPLWYNYFLVCELPTWWVWDLTVWQKHPSYHLVVASSLSLDVEYLFSWLQSFLMMAIQQLVVILSFLWEEVRSNPFCYFCEKRWDQILLLQHLVSPSCPDACWRLPSMTTQVFFLHPETPEGNNSAYTLILGFWPPEADAYGGVMTSQ